MTERESTPLMMAVPPEPIRAPVAVPPDSTRSVPPLVTMAPALLAPPEMMTVPPVALDVGEVVDVLDTVKLDVPEL